MPEQHAALHLPDGSCVNLAGGSADLSVFGYVRAHGVWERDIGAFFAGIVQSDWTCVDIGANIGCHTLGLASLATRGRVIAFEASPRNFLYLKTNVAALPGSGDRVRCEQLALWSGEADLNFVSMDALAGCNFVSRSVRNADNEDLIRSLVPAAALADHQLGLQTSSVKSVAFDSWWETHGSDRLDLIKIDIEGAEIEAIQGARAAIRRHDPILVTEYNPSCAATFRDAPRHEYYDLLASMFEIIAPIGPEGVLGEPFGAWRDVDAALQQSQGWLDLCCRKAR